MRERHTPLRTGLHLHRQNHKQNLKERDKNGGSMTRTNSLQCIYMEISVLQGVRRERALLALFGNGKECFMVSFG